MSRDRRGRVILAALIGSAGVLLALELALGAPHYGNVRLADPCMSRPSFRGGGVDGAVQRVALDSLDGAACRLHTTREELILSLGPNPHAKPIEWDRPTIRAAVTAGFRRAVSAAEARGGFDGLAARLLDRLAGSDLIRWLLGGATGF
jgi:hypothetical protein